MAGDRKAYPLRLREDLYDALRRWAEDDMRSVNGQIEFLLHDAIKRAGRLRAAAPAAQANAPASDLSDVDSGDNATDSAGDGDHKAG